MNKLLYICLCFLFVETLSAQRIMLQKADENYENLAYVDATEIYEAVLRSGYSNEEILKKVANAYYFRAEYRKAYPHYKKLFRLQENLAPEYFFRFAHTLKAVNRHAEAYDMLVLFNEKSKADSRGKLAIEQPDVLAESRKNPNKFQVGIAAINSKASDYGTSFYLNKVVFTSARDTGGIKNRVHKWTNTAFTKMYIADMHPRTKELSNVREFAKELNTKYHESTPTFSADGKRMFFTRNNFYNNEKKENREGIMLLKIYEAVYRNGQWVEVGELPFCSDEFSTAHPFISPDEKFLYFASDREGTHGKSDIYRVAMLANGEFGEPENLGNLINTEGRESYPFVSSDGKLYFASDGHPGIGGFDIFVAIPDDNGNFIQVVNLGEPINSTYDDFGIVLEEDQTGFFTSNRSNGRYKYDNIYRIKKGWDIVYNCRRKLKVMVEDRITQKRIPNANIKIFDKNMKLIEETKTNQKGEIYASVADCGAIYYVRAGYKSYETKEQSIKMGESDGTDQILLALRERRKEIKKGTDLAKVLEIERIYFDLDKWDIRPDAAVELQKIVEVMKKYPEMKIEIGSHTDSRASFEYNETLSQRRASSTRNWIISQGIEANRITAKGYGESRLVNECSDGVPCSEEKHQANRRSEFIILELEE